jgi:NAD(P)-dependent dehydrogenase (short-subunit alcohol dehydrogenase family)
MSREKTFLMPFEPKVAIVTGASRGIGRATAIALARRGIGVALAARSREALLAVEKEIGASAISIPTDVSDEAAVAAMVERTARELGPIDLLVNNAGTLERAQVVETDAAAWDRVLDVNLKGAFLCTRAVLPSMIDRGRGRIVNVSSISGKLGTPLLSSYCASKWGLLGFSLATAEEMKPHGIQVFSVCPGSVNTVMLEQGLPGSTPDMEPEDVASVIVYLGTEAPDAMTGAAVDVFG